MTPALSLYQIESDLQQLIDYRETLICSGEAKPGELATAEKMISEYLTRESVKVRSYVGLIRQTEATIEARRRERDRHAEALKSAESLLESLKASALRAMQAHDVKELTATDKHGGVVARLTRRGNGGKEPLEVEWPKYADGSYKPLSLNDVPKDFVERGLLNAHYTPNTSAVRESFNQRIVCKDCKGTGYAINHPPIGENSGMTCKCGPCDGKGTLSAAPPGARLLPRAEHLKVE